MANVFDQFDNRVVAGAINVFDQFDMPQATQASLDLTGDTSLDDIPVGYRSVELADRGPKSITDYSLAENLIGAGENLLSTATGLVAGTPAMMLGNVMGAAGELTGQLTPEEAERVGQRFASNVTYQPRTQAGQEQQQTISEYTESLPPTLTGAMGKGGVSFPRASVQTRPNKSQFTEALAAVSETPSDTMISELVKQSKKRKPNLEKLAGDMMIDTDVANAAERLGVFDELTPGMISKNPTFQDVEGAIRAKAAGDLSKQAEQAISSLSQKADDFISDYGGQLDKAGLGQDVKENMLSNIANLEKQANAAYDTVNSIVSPQHKVNMSSIVNKLNAEADNLGGAQYLEPFEKRLLKISESKPSYALLDKERKKIGAALHKKQGVYKDMDSGRLKRAYADLKQAQGESLDGLPADAKSAWDSANNLTRERKLLEEDSKKLFGNDLRDALMPKIGGALMKLQKSDYGKIDKIIDAIPKDMRENAMVTALNDVFTKGSNKEQQLNISGFVDWYGSVKRQPELIKRINNNLPSGAAKRLNDIYVVSKSIRDANSKVIKTGVADKTLKSLGETQTLISKVFKPMLKFGPIEGVATAMGNPGLGLLGLVMSKFDKSVEDKIKSADRLMTEPKFKDLAVSLAKSNYIENKATKLAEKSLRKTERYKRWYNALTAEDKAQIGRAGLAAYLLTDEDDTKREVSN